MTVITLSLANRKNRRFLSNTFLERQIKTQTMLRNQDNKTFHLLASKLGLNQEKQVLSKAAELVRILQTKSTSEYNISETSKIVICLDLAASLNRIDVDMSTLIKFSGLKRTVYENSKKNIEKLLNIKCKALTITELCVALGCDSLKELATNILNEYQKEVTVELDFNLPQYVCMAVYQAHRISDVKVLKSKIVETSRLKPAQWKKMDEIWTKFVDEKFVVAEQMKKISSHNQFLIGETASVEHNSTNETEVKPEVEHYEVWKIRILENAYKKLEQEKGSHFIQCLLTSM